MPGLKPPFGEADHFKGNSKSPVQLLEYGDFQCPHCGAAHPIIQQIEKKYGSRLVFIFRHFPLAESHPFAQIAAVASEAAARQGKFWEMHDLIYENQAGLNNEYLLELAKVLHLNMKTFQTDLADRELFEKVESDFESGIISGVNGTPSFYINGNKYNGPNTFQSLANALELAIISRQ
jgi:protein-disulfide isomerase